MMLDCAFGMAARGAAFDFSGRRDSLQSPNPKLTRLAFLLVNGEARAQFQMAPAERAQTRDSVRNMCLVPAGATVWACSERGGPLEFSSLAFDAQEVSALLETDITREVLSTPQLNFSNERIWHCARQLAEDRRRAGGCGSLRRRRTAACAC